MVLVSIRQLRVPQVAILRRKVSVFSWTQRDFMYRFVTYTGWAVQGSNPDRMKRFFFPQNAHTGCGTQPAFPINPLNTKRRLLYLKTQFVPRSKHFSSRL